MLDSNSLKEKDIKVRVEVSKWTEYTYIVEYVLLSLQRSYENNYFHFKSHLLSINIYFASYDKVKMLVPI